MKQKYDFLPQKLTRDEIALAPSNWVKVLLRYSHHKRKALREIKPNYYTLLTAVTAAIAKKDRRLIDIATELTKDNIPRHIYLSLVSSALKCFGEKTESLKMLREAMKLDQSPFILLGLAVDTDDLDEKENLAKKVLNENPKNSEALRQLAYAKYFKEEVDEAEHIIDKILLEEPDNYLATEFKGNVYFDKKEYHKALEQYLKIKLKPKPISLLLKICHCYYLIGKTHKAKKIAKSIKDKIDCVSDLDCSVEYAQQILTEILNS